MLEALHVPRSTASDPAADVALPLMTKRQFGILLLIGAVLLAGVLALLFGPARGARQDIGAMTADLDASRGGIYEQLDTARTQLTLAEQSLTIQQQGLEVAVAGEKDASVAAQSSQQILEQTQQALALVREVTQALGPLDRLDDKVDSVVANVEQGVRLAQSALDVARQTLSTGQQALAVARDTLATLKRSEQLQRDLLATARATLEQTREINRKIPGAPVFPTSGAR